MGQNGRDDELLNIAECFEGVLQARKPPDLRHMET